MGLFMSCSYLGLTLMIQVSICFLELFVQLMSMCFTPLLPVRPVFLLALILAEWVYMLIPCSYLYRNP
jgi:hypothetical protein